MKASFIAFFIVLVSLTKLVAQNDSVPAKEPRDFVMTEGDTTYTMRRYIMVFLMRGDRATTYSKEELEKIQAGHMGNINRLAAEGKILVAGPFGDDTDFRGIFIMDCETIEEAEELVGTDPAVKAGRLRAEYHPWWTARGTVIK